MTQGLFHPSRLTFSRWNAYTSIFDAANLELDVRIGGKRSPLMVAATQTAASLCKCFEGELRRIAYPEK